MTDSRNSSAASLRESVCCPSNCGCASPCEDALPAASSGKRELLWKFICRAWRQIEKWLIYGSDPAILFPKRK